MCQCKFYNKIFLISLNAIKYTINYIKFGNIYIYIFNHLLCIDFDLLYLAREMDLLFL